MKSIKILIAMLILIMSVGTVCAAENITDDAIGDDSQEILESTQDDVVAVDDSPQSFSQLNEKITNATGNYLELDSDYKFNSSSDNNNGVVIRNNNFVLDGKGHTIDANNQARAFVILGTNVTVNNLTIINANSQAGSAFIIPSGSLTTNYVNIENCAAAQGVVYAENGPIYTNNHGKITDSTSKSMGVVYIVNSTATFNNVFMSSSKELAWGFVYGRLGATITVLNSVFANTTSQYSTAIMSDKSTIIRNSKFINLYANFTAGAVAIKGMPEDAVIENCTFVNVSSSKNGGALFIDVYGDEFKHVSITNSTFTDCDSGFGGAIMALGGNITIEDCNFTNDIVLFDGGAIYTSHSIMTISNSIFNANGGLGSVLGRDSYGGAIYGDVCELNLYNSRLINNFAQSGSAIYLYDSDYDIENNAFDNNSDLNGTYADIYTAFDKTIHTLKDNNYSSDNPTSLNNELYETIVDLPGVQIELLNNTIDITTLPSKFDLRDWGWVTPVKNQGNMLSCWAFATAGALESSILRYLGISMSLSENNIQAMGLQYSRYGISGMTEAGAIVAGSGYALGWFGVFASDYDVYDQLGKVSPIIAPTSAIHFQDLIIIPPRKNSTDNDLLKEAILKYGAVGIAYHGTNVLPYVNGFSQYIPDTVGPNHGVALIGWDDNYPKENFYITPPDNGAWIIKNSWGETVGDKGYYYISYYDTTFATVMESYAFILNNTVPYNKNYQVNVIGALGFLDISNEYKNIYEALDDDLIAGVGTYFNQSGAEYTVEIYVNDVLRHTQSGISPYYGFHTIQLDTFVPVKKGDVFTVKIKSNNGPIQDQSRLHYPANTSFYLKDGEWKDASLENHVCVIKAYTVADDCIIIDNADIEVDYRSDSYFTVKVVTADGHAVGAGAEVNFTINGKTTTILTDEDGTAKIKITETPGTYTMTTTLNGKDYTNTVTVIQVPTPAKSFAELEEAIENSTLNYLNLYDDYEFNNETGNKLGILIDRDNFIINGNGHTIDGKNISRIFNITSNNITINDLVLINGNAEKGGAIYDAGLLTLNNVTFINNYASKNGGAVAIYEDETINCNNSKFIDNYAGEGGSSIVNAKGKLNLYNAYITSKIYAKAGQIMGSNGARFYLENIAFVNTTATYSPAIYLVGSKIRIIDSKFINLKANLTAGAMSLREGGELYIKNCEFINTTSSRNAGAIYVDITGYAPDNEGNVTIIDSKFKDTSSGFAGAYVQLGGQFWLSNSEFTNNHATYNGGSVYLSFTETEISNCTFESNGVEVIEGYPTYGGAIFSDISTLNITDSRFFNNVASEGNAIYAYDSSLNIKGSTFKNNTNAVFSVFTKECNIDTSTVLNNDTVSTNNTFYATIMVGEGMQVTLVNNTINVDVIPAKFDLRDWGWVSSVKNQGWMGACWTFGMTGSLESVLLKATGIPFNVSMNNMKTVMKYSPYGAMEVFEGGANLASAGYLLSWLGAIPYDADTYDELGKITMPIVTDNNIHVQDIIFVPNSEIPNGTQIKLAIMKYGSLDVSFFGQSSFDDEVPYYNPKTNAQYVDVPEGANHEVSIIGWDDNFPKEKFLITPPGNGAWIIKNSYGSEWGDNGYLYVSYYDQSLLHYSLGKVTDYAAIPIIENTVPYNKNYQYDITWLSNYASSNGTISYMNVFEALDDDLIAGVGTYFNESGVSYTVKIYVNDELRLTQEGISPYVGYHTIKLDSYIPIKKGDVFKAAITSNWVPYLLLEDTRVHYTQNLSFVSFDGKTWQDAYDLGYINCLKVYTVADDSEITNNKDISVDYNGGKYFSVKVVTSDGIAVAGTSVKFNINGVTKTVKTNSNGVAKIKITQTPKKYTIKTTYNGKTVKNTVTVKQVLTASKLTVKKTAKKFTLKAKLKINGKLVKGKQITFKFNGKTYKVKTNAKGIAQKTLNKKVINKLKKGKTYTVKVTYLKDTIKTTVKVK